MIAHRVSDRAPHSVPVQSPQSTSQVLPPAHLTQKGSFRCANYRPAPPPLPPFVAANLSQKVHLLDRCKVLTTNLSEVMSTGSETRHGVCYPIRLALRCTMRPASKSGLASATRQATSNPQRIFFASYFAATTAGRGCQQPWMALRHLGGSRSRRPAGSLQHSATFPSHPNATKAW